MSFGFSVGDFLAVFNLTNKIRKEFVDALKQFMAISDEVRSLSFVILDIETVLSKRELHDEQKTELKEIENSCGNVLNELQHTLEKYDELNLGNGSVSKRVARVWKRLKWEPEDIKQLRDRISTNVGLLNAFTTRLTRDHIVILVQSQEDQGRQTLLDWITPIDYAPQQSDIISRLQVGTGKSLLDSVEFKAWLQIGKNTLFCPGIPGAGKSTFTSIVIPLNPFQPPACRGNLFATSRPISRIEKRFKGAAILQVRASEEDLRGYLEGQMFRLPGFVTRSPDLQDEIKTRVIETVDGMFLLARLYFESFIRKTTTKAVRTVLQNLATGSGTYDQAYKEAMERINGQSKDQTELAKQVLQWITCAKGPLTTSELQHALAVEIGESQLDEDNIAQVEEIISVCAGLVTVDERSSIVRLVHYTAQEYFERTRSYHFLNSEANIAITCVTYLSFEAFEHGYCQSDCEFEERLLSYPFYKYAAQNWGRHARQALKCSPEIIKFLKMEGQVNASSQAQVAVKKWSGHSNYSQKFSKQTTGLHLAAYFGVEDAVDNLLQDCRVVNLRDSYGRTPLLLAAANGHGAVVQLLLEKDAEVNSEDVCRRTPLSLAARNGFEAVVQFLLEGGAKVESKDGSCQVQLWLAALKGWEAAIELLLEDGADIDEKNSSYQTPLSWAAMCGDEAIIELLLEEGADIDWYDCFGKTPLLWAAENEHETIVELLLKKGAHIDWNGSSGQTLLSWAIVNGHETIVQIMLEECAEVDLKDSSGQTPLSRAAENGRKAIVQFLLEKGANIDSKDSYGWTPLKFAADNKYEAIVQLLLDKGAEFDSKDKYGRTLLSWAAVSGNEAVVKLLIEKGAEVDSKDKYNHTPLSLAITSGHETVVNLLKEKGAKANLEDKYSQTPLLLAVESGGETILVLNSGYQSVE